MPQSSTPNRNDAAPLPASSTASTPAPAKAPRATSWVEVVRLRTLPAAGAPVILGAGAALALEAFSLARTLLALGVALALQIGSNLANDYADGLRGTDDERTGPPRLTASGQVRPQTVKYAAFACFALAGVCGLILLTLCGQWWLLLVGAAAVLAAWFYTGGAHPYGYAGFGEVFVFIFFGLVATCGTVYVQSAQVPGWVWLVAVGIGLIACALLMVNNLRDIDTDPQHGKMTLAVRLGERRARKSFAALVYIPAVIALAVLLWVTFYCKASLLYGIVISVVFTAFLGTLAYLVNAPVKNGNRGMALIVVLRNTGLYELVYGVALAAAIAWLSLL